MNPMTQRKWAAAFAPIIYLFPLLTNNEWSEIALWRWLLAPILLILMWLTAAQFAHLDTLAKSSPVKYTIVTALLMGLLFGLTFTGMSDSDPVWIMRMGGAGALAGLIAGVWGGTKYARKVA